MIEQEGYLTLIRRNSGKLTDSDFAQARKEGCLKELVESCDLDHVHGPQHNLICHPWAGSLFPRLFYSAAVGPYWWQTTDTDWSFLLACCLTTSDTEPVVTDSIPAGDPYFYDSFAAKVNNYFGTTYISHKFFHDQQAEADEIKSDPMGRESMYYRERWLWTPSDFTSSNIRSFYVITGYNEGGTSETGYIGTGGRIRLKDSNGLPVIYSKTANQILLAEYKFILASV